MESNSKKVILSFKAPPPRSYAQIIPAVLFIPAGIAVLIIMAISIPKLYEENKMTISQWSGAFMVFIGTLWSLYSFIQWAIGFWTSCYFIDLTEVSVIGYNLWKKPKEILYEDIIAIKKYKRSNSMLIITDNKIMRINANIDYFGKCVEAIRERSVNVREVDYDGLDKDPSIWNHYYGWDEKMKKIDERFPRKKKQ